MSARLANLFFIVLLSMGLLLVSLVTSAPIDQAAESNDQEWFLDESLGLFKSPNNIVKGISHL